MKLVASSICAILLGIATPAVVIAQNSRTIDCGQSYTIASGDTLSGISSRAYGTLAYQSLYEHNIGVVGSDPNMVRVGQVLEIPCLGADAGTNSTTPATTEVAAAEPEATEPDAATDDGTLVFTFNKTSAPPFIINSGIIDPYLAEIAEVTEGRVQFVDPDEMSRDQAEQFELVTSGDVDATYVLNTHLSASHPLLQLPMMPLMGGSAEQTAVSLWRLHEEYLSKTDYFEDATLLGFISAPAAHIWRETSAPVTAAETIADKNLYAIPYFKGLDIRGPKVLRQEVAAWLADYTAENDAPPTYFLAHGAAMALGIWNENLTATEVDNGLYTPTFSVIISNEAWSRISAKDQMAIRAVSGERLSTRSASWDEFDNGFRSQMVANGLKTKKADQAILESLRFSSIGAMNTWMTSATSLNIPATDALNFYLESLRSLEDRLLFR